MKLGEFFLSVVVDATTGQLTIKNLISSIGDLEAITVAQIGAFFEMANAIAEVTESTMKASLGIERNVSGLDMHADAMQRWQNVAKETLLTTPEEMADAIKYLSQGIADYNLGKPMAGGFQTLIDRFGIDFTKQKTSAEMLNQIIKALNTNLKDSPENEKLELLKTGGPLGGLLAVAELSEAKRRAAYENAPIISEAEMRKMHELASEFHEIQKVSTRIGELIAGWVAPKVVDGLKALESSIKFDAEILERTRKRTLLENVEEGLGTIPLALKGLWGRGIQHGSRVQEQAAEELNVKGHIMDALVTSFAEALANKMNNNPSLALLNQGLYSGGAAGQGAAPASFVFDIFTHPDKDAHYRFAKSAAVDVNQKAHSSVQAYLDQNKS